MIAGSTGGSQVSQRLAALLSHLVPQAPEGMAGRVRFEQLASLLRLTPVMMSANIFNAVLVCVAGPRVARLVF